MHVIDQQTVNYILQKYPLDEQRLKVAVQSAKITLQIIYDKVSVKYIGSKATFFPKLLEARRFSISGNSIATLIRNYYLYPDYNFSRTADSYFIIDSDTGHESDIDIYFHDLMFNQSTKDSIRIMMEVLRKSYDEDSTDVFDANIKIANTYTASTYNNKSIPEYTKEGKPLITDNAVTMQDGTQFVIHSIGFNFNEHFDFEHCKMKYDGKNLYASKLQLICAVNKLLLEATHTKQYRLQKYLSRGFSRLREIEVADIDF